MKKKLAIVLTLILSFVACMFVVGCEEPEPPHEHSYSSQRTEATCTTDGEVVYTCSCGDSYTETLTATGHQNIQFSDVVEPTCVATGTKEFWYCSDCNASWKDEECTITMSDFEKVLPTVPHSYSGAWAWTGYESATITITCSQGCDFNQNFNASLYSYTDTYATCTTDGLRKHEASCYFENTSYTDIKDEVIPAYTHSYGEPDWRWSGVTSAKATFTCSRNSSHVEVITATITSSETIPPTCSSLGQTTYTATVTFNENTYTATETRYDIPTKPHTYEELDESSWYWSSKYVEDMIADFDKKYTAKVTVYCSGENCNSSTQKDATVTAEMTTPVLCTTNGEATYTASYVINGQAYTATKTETIRYQGHKYAETNLCLNCTWINLSLSSGVDNGVEFYWVNGIQYRNNSMTKMVIPASCWDKPLRVKSFGSANSYLEEIEILEGVEYVLLDSLSNTGWTNLKNIYLPSTLKTLSFSYYNAEDFVPYCNEYEGGYYLGTKDNPYFVLVTVQDTTITELNVHGDTVMICETALGYQNNSITFSSLTTVNIGKALKELPKNLFEKCTALQTITVDSENQHITTNGGIVYNKALTEIIAVPKKISGDIVIPDTVSVIPAKTFAGSLITSFNTGDGVTVIEGGVATDCNNLNSVILGKKVETVGTKDSEAFKGCPNLEYLSVGENVTEVHTSFHFITGVGNSIEEVSLKTLNVENVMNFVTTNIFGMGFAYWHRNIAFMVNGQATDTLVVPEGVTEYNTNIRMFDIMHVYLPSTLQKIGAQAFHTNTALITIGIPASVTEIGAGAFAGCYATNVYCEAKEKPAGWDQYWYRDLNYGGPCVFWNAPNHNDINEGGSCVVVKDNIRYQIDKENKTARLITQSSALRGDANGVFTIPTSFNYEGTVYTVTYVNSEIINSPHINTVRISKNLKLAVDMPVNTNVKIIFLGTIEEFRVAADIVNNEYYYNRIMNLYDIEFTPIG